MADPQTTFDHPVLRCAAEIGEALDRVAEVDPMTMPTPAKAEALVELSRLADRLYGLRLRVLAGADDVALDAGMRSAASWLAHQVRGPADRWPPRADWPSRWSPGGAGSGTR